MCTHLLLLLNNFHIFLSIYPFSSVNISLVFTVSALIVYLPRPFFSSTHTHSHSLALWHLAPWHTLSVSSRGGGPWLTSDGPNHLSNKLREGEREREREAGRQLRLSVNHSVDREGKECVFHCAKVSLRQSTPERERKKDWLIGEWMPAVLSARQSRIFSCKCVHSVCSSQWK